MTVTIETGRGVRNANSYASIAFVSTYLTNRNRETAWDAAIEAVRNAAVVAATDYIEHRWGQRFKGVREFFFEDVKAEGLITFTGVSVAAETLLVGDQLYTFVVTLTSPAVVNEVVVGGDAAGSTQNLFEALTRVAANEGVTFSTGTLANRHVTATIDSVVITLVAVAEGSSGDSTALTGPLANATLTAFTGGDDGGSQTLSFPQSGLFDRTGIKVEGVPLRLRQATAEYADRARSAILAPDPSVDAQGGSIVSLREKIGPVETETQYSEGTHLAIVLRPYPAADRLLQDYLVPAGSVVR